MIRSLLVLTLLSTLLAAFAVSVRADDEAPKPYMESENGKRCLEKLNEALPKADSLPALPTDSMSEEELSNHSSAYNSIQNVVWGCAEEATNGTGFRAVSDSVSGVKGFKGKTAGELGQYLEKLREKYNTLANEFEHYNEKKAARAEVAKDCADRGFAATKEGDRIAVTEPGPNAGTYWPAKVVGKSDWIFTVIYEYRGPKSEPVAVKCENMAKLDDSSKDIRNFKNAEEAGAAFGSYANALHSAKKDLARCKSATLTWDTKKKKCVPLRSK